MYRIMKIKSWILIILVLLVGVIIRTVQNQKGGIENRQAGIGGVSGSKAIVGVGEGGYGGDPYKLLDQLWEHVYHPKRLQINRMRDSVVGSVMRLKKEGDGDYHIQIMLDEGYRDHLNDQNLLRQHGGLVVEIICINNIKQADAVEGCVDCPLELLIPKVGQRVKVYGSFITDTQHGWNEIHPVSRVEVIGE